VRGFVFKGWLMKLPNGDNPWALLIQVALALALMLYLFGRRKSTFGRGARRIQRIEMKLSGGLQPSEVRLLAGHPAQLVIHRYDREPYDELFEIEELGVYELLPALHTTIIAIHPTQPGRFAIVLGGEKRAGTMIVE
jgi:plastocyanin domain-containing protein